MARLAHGGRIDRGRALSFTFDGRAYTGYAGDTLASALLANDVALVGRSFKYHRPRGVMAAGAEEPNALLQVGEGAASEPNMRATQVELYDGLVARPQNCYPSVAFDLRATLDAVHALFPAGFYYKTFIWPRWSWYEDTIRRSAGLGVAESTRDPDRYTARYAHCDLLIVGGGPCGLRAAEVAAPSGARILWIDDQPEFGGSLLWRGDAEARASLAARLAALVAHRNLRRLARTSAIGYYDHNLVVLHERLTHHLGRRAPEGAPRERVWQVRARRVIAATGATERPLVFPDNDRPGVMLADAALHYLARYAVVPGQRAVLFANHDRAYDAIFALADAGVQIDGAIDVRRNVGERVAAELQRRGIRCVAGSAISAVLGRRRVRGVRTNSLAGGAGTTLDCDLVLMSGGWTPGVQLFAQSGGKLRFDAAQSCFRPAQPTQDIRCVGAAEGIFDASAALLHAASVAAAAVSPSTPWPPPPTDDSIAAPFAPEPFWQVPNTMSRQRQWVDFQNDVTAGDLALAVRENFVSVEHLKRYTTTGMATDQGRTSNVNALAILAQQTGREIAAVGTTTFRAPIVPISVGSLAGRHIGALYRALRLLPAHEQHVARAAQLADYGGWQRPEAYPLTGETFSDAVLREALAVRNAVGLFDSSSLGNIEVAGPDAEKFLDHMCVTRIEGLAEGRIRYFVMANERGIVLDDGVVMRLAPDRYWVAASSAHAAQIAQSMDEWLQCEWTTWRVTVTDATRQWATLSLAGPRARAVLAAAGTDIDLDAARFAHMSLRDGAVAGIPARVARVSFSGELQFEINVPAGYASELWDRLMAAGATEGIAPIGMEAWLGLRIEKGYPIVGIDTDGTTTPDDLGAPSWRAKASNFVGRRSLTIPEATRAGRLQLVGLEAEDAAARLPVGAHLLPSLEAKLPCPSIGRVTSSLVSRSLGRSVALALLADGRKRIGESVCAYFDGARRRAKIVPPAFYDPAGARLHA